MPSIHTPTTPDARTAAVRRFAHAAMLAGAIALGAGTFGHTAIAGAEWDIETYDKCMGTVHKPDESYNIYCCLDSGGKWDDNSKTCRAPVDRSQILQNIPLGPKLGTTQQSVPPMNTLGAPVS